LKPIPKEKSLAYLSEVLRMGTKSLGIRYESQERGVPERGSVTGGGK